MLLYQCPVHFFYLLHFIVSWFFDLHLLMDIANIILIIRMRIMAMEQQIANLAGMVRSALSPTPGQTNGEPQKSPKQQVWWVHNKIMWLAV